MKNYLVRGVLSLVFLGLVLQTPANAQKGGGGTDGGTSACSGISVYTSSPQVTRGYNIGVVAMVVNCSTSKQRVTVNFTSTPSCGGESAIGYNRVALNPGQGIQVTVSYFIPADACPGVYTITATSSAGKGVTSTATTTFTVV